MSWIVQDLARSESRTRIALDQSLEPHSLASSTRSEISEAMNTQLNHKVAYTDFGFIFLSLVSTVSATKIWNDRGWGKERKNRKRSRWRWVNGRNGVERRGGPGGVVEKSSVMEGVARAITRVDKLNFHWLITRFQFSPAFFFLFLPLQIIPVQIHYKYPMHEYIKKN